jgi:ABC-2 type transport system ATP-binding protein
MHIELKNLYKENPGFTLDHISFAVPQGSITGADRRKRRGQSTTCGCCWIWQSRKAARCCCLVSRCAGVNRTGKRKKSGVVLDESNFFLMNFSARDLERVLRSIYQSWIVPPTPNAWLSSALTPKAV